MRSIADERRDIVLCPAGGEFSPRGRRLFFRTSLGFVELASDLSDALFPRLIGVCPLLRILYRTPVFWTMADQVDLLQSPGK